MINMKFVWNRITLWIDITFDEILNSMNEIWKYLSSTLNIGFVMWPSASDAIHCLHCHLCLMASRDSKVSTGCTLQNLRRRSTSSWYFLHTVLVFEYYEFGHATHFKYCFPPIIEYGEGRIFGCRDGLHNVFCVQYCCETITILCAKMLMLCLVQGQQIYSQKCLFCNMHITLRCLNLNLVVNMRTLKYRQ